MVDPVNPHDTTDYGQQQEADLQFKSASGDIRDLYAYYRFSDHQLTNIGLKEKVYKREPVWFEGHMDWTFKECMFKIPFYFGVEGNRLTEDNRETEINPEPFPGYGFNGLHFDACKFKIDNPDEFGTTFEIRDNCNVVFKGCAFEKGNGETYLTLTIGDNCRVEFINCKFECALAFDTFCDVKFRDCEFAENQNSYVSASDHCKLHFTNCDMSAPPKNGNWMSVANDCSVVIHGGGANPPTLLGKTGGISLADNCHVKIYKMKKVCCTEGIIFSLTNGSKVETFDVEEMSCNAGICFDVENGEVYVRNTELLKTGSGPTIRLNDGVFRSDNVEEMRSSQGSVIGASNGSKAQVKNTEAIISGMGSAIALTASTVDLADITLVQGMICGVTASGAGRSYLRRVETVNGMQASGIDLSDGAELYGYTVTSITGGQLAGVTLDSARFEITDGTTIYGPKGGIVGTQAHTRVEQVTTISGDDEAGVSLADSAYDIRNVQTMSGLSGLSVSNCRGVLLNVGTISGEQGPGAVIEDCSGPTEWDTITTITSAAEDGLSVSGNLKQLRIINVDTITSTSADGVSWTQASGTTFLGYVLSITSTSEVGMTAVVTIGSLELKEIDSITAKKDTLVISGEGEVYGSILGTLSSQEGTALSVSMSSSGKARFRDLGTITSMEGTGASLTAQGSAEVSLWTVTSPISSQEGDALLATASGDSYITLRDIAGVTSEQGRALVATASSTAGVHIQDITGEVTSQEGVAATITTSGDGSITLNSIADVTSQEGNAAVITASGGVVTVHDITSFTSDQGKALVATASGTAKVDIYDITSACTSQEATVWQLTLSGKSYMTIHDTAGVTGQNGKAVEVNVGAETTLLLDNNTKITSTQGDAFAGTVQGTLKVSNMNEISSQQGKVISLSGSSAPASWIEFINIPSVKGTTPSGDAIEITGIGTIRLISIDEINGGNCAGKVIDLTGLGPQLGKVEVIDVLSIKASASQGGLNVTDCGDVQVYCTASKGEIALSGSGNALGVINGNIIVRNFSKIQCPEPMKAVYFENVGHATLDSIDYIEGARAIHVLINSEILILDCPEIRSLGGGTYGLDIQGTGRGVVRGKAETVVYGSDSGVPGVRLEGDHNTRNDFHLFRVSTPPGKGGLGCNNITGYFHGCNFDGGLASIHESRIEAFSTMMTVGLLVSHSKFEMYDSEIALGRNEGPEQYLDIVDSSFQAYHSTVTGSKPVTLRGSVVLISDAKQAMEGSEWTLTESVLQAIRADWNSDIIASTDSVVQLTKVDSGKVKLTGADQVFEGHKVHCGELLLGTDCSATGNYLEADYLTIGNNSAVFASYLVTVNPSTFGLNTALFVNQGTMGDLAFDTGASVVLNKVTTGVINSVDDLAILAANWSGTTVDFGNNCALVGPRMRLSGSWSFGSGMGLISAKGAGTWDATIQDTGAIYAKHDSAIASPGENIGIVAAAMDYDVNLSFVSAFENRGGGIVIAKQKSGTSFAQGIIGASCTSVEGLGCIAAGGNVAKGGINAYGYGGVIAAACNHVYDADAVIMAGGQSWGLTNSKAIITAAGKHDAISPKIGSIVVGPYKVTHLTGANTACHLVVGGYSSQGMIDQITTPVYGGAVYIGAVGPTLQADSSVLCVKATRLDIPDGCSGIGVGVENSGGNSILNGQGILLMRNAVAGGQTGQGIVVADTEGLASGLSGSTRTGIFIGKDCMWMQNSLGYGNGGTSLLLGASGIGALPPSAGNQVRAAALNIVDIAETIHHNIPLGD